jgi:hypothetical protein
MKGRIKVSLALTIVAYRKYIEGPACAVSRATLVRPGTRRGVETGAQIAQISEAKRPGGVRFLL